MCASSIDLFTRLDNAATPWTNMGAANNSISHTLTANLINNRGEYIVELCPLPVEFLYLRANIQSSNETLIEWGTALEENNDYFEVQVMNNSSEFRSIGRITPNPSKTYSFIDKHSQSGVNYYRIKQVDTDGKINYSAVVSTVKSSGDSFTLFPVPFENELIFSSANSDFYEIAIYNSTGSLISTHQINNNYTETVINTEALEKGFYIVCVKSNQGNYYKKILKQ